MPGLAPLHSRKGRPSSISSHIKLSAAGVRPVEEALHSYPNGAKLKNCLQSAKGGKHELQAEALRTLKDALRASGKQASAFQVAEALVRPSRPFSKPLVIFVTTRSNYDDSYKGLQNFKGASGAKVGAGTGKALVYAFLRIRCGLCWMFMHMQEARQMLLSSSTWASILSCTSHH